jgi:hypothetical protein
MGVEYWFVYESVKCVCVCILAGGHACSLFLSLFCLLLCAGLLPPEDGLLLYLPVVFFTMRGCFK